MLENDLEDNPFDVEIGDGFKVQRKNGKEPRDDESDEEEREDRQYAWKIIKK